MIYIKHYTCSGFVCAKRLSPSIVILICERENVYFTSRCRSALALYEETKNGRSALKEGVKYFYLSSLFDHLFTRTTYNK